jgi:hypothetical protein
MNVRANYKLILGIVTEVINEWDPCSLLESGAPPNEYETEIMQVVSRLQSGRSAADIATAIYQVFSSAFSRDDIAASSCDFAAKRLLEALSAADLM